jgi:hypothetical protein
MFTALAFGLCAYMMEPLAGHFPNPVVVIGEVVGEKCKPYMMLPDAGPTPPLRWGHMESAHRFQVQIGEHNALVWVDSEMVSVPRGEPI